MGTIWLPRITQHLLALTAIITLLAVVPARANAQDDGQEPHITVEISQVDYLKDVHSSDDWTPEAEAKAVIVTQRTCKGRQAAMKLPATGYVSLLPEQSTTEF